MTITATLAQLGWKLFFQQQLNLEEWQHCIAGRVVGQHRSTIELATEQGRQLLSVLPSMPSLVVGDWILLDKQQRFYRLLERLSLFSRKASGSKAAVQPIAANIDTVFIVCSLNSDFNLNRIERYLVMASDAGAEPVVVLTKADCCNNTEDYLQQVQSLDPMLATEAVNSLAPQSVKVLEPWCIPGSTVAFMGSSGVGKSTLVNTLLGIKTQATGTIRESDSKGRHTTTARSLHLMPSGALLLDTPGMRELQLASCEQGIEGAFADISKLATTCRFNDCQHHSEPGCAVQAAISDGLLEQRRLDNYRKLAREQALNNATLAEKRLRARNLGRYYREVQKQNRKWKKE